MCEGSQEKELINSLGPQCGPVQLVALVKLIWTSSFFTVCCIQMLHIYMLRFEDINENVPDYGNHNPTYKLRYRQPANHKTALYIKMA